VAEGAHIETLHKFASVPSASSAAAANPLDQGRPIRTDGSRDSRHIRSRLLGGHGKPHTGIRGKFSRRFRMFLARDGPG
jgi:hypothetical protein